MDIQITKNLQINLSNDWAYLFSRCRWYSFQFIGFDILLDNEYKGWEVDISLLGFGIFIRYTSDRGIEKLEEIIEVVKKDFELMKDEAK